MSHSEVVREFLERVKAGEPVEFEETITLIDHCYSYTPARFINGVGADQVVSDPGTNMGSLKIFSFASLQCLDPQQTLALFGKFYREDVLGHPEGVDHRNIRAFMKTGWSAVHFESSALSPR